PSACDKRQRLVDHAQHRIEVMPAAQDQARGGGDAIDALLACEFRIFLDAVERDFRTATEYREHRPIFQEFDRVIAPLTGGHFSSVKAENAIELAAAECDLIHRGGGKTRWGSAPRRLAWIDFAGTERHAAPPGWVRLLITPAMPHRKRPLRARKSRQLDKIPVFRDHAAVKRIIILPKFGQSRDMLLRHIGDCCLKARSGSSPDSSAPQPPGLGRPGQLSSAYGSIPKDFRAGFTGPIFLCNRYSDFSVRAGYCKSALAAPS